MVKYIYKQRRGTTAQWATSSIIPYDAEIVLEQCVDGSYKIKIGDGVHTFAELPYQVSGSSIDCLADAELYTDAEILEHAGNNSHITAQERSGWNTAEEKSHEHENKAILDAITSNVVIDANYVHTDNNFTTEEKIKLNNISVDGNGEISDYVLPVAGESLGGIKAGGDITVDSNGNVFVNDDSHNHIIGNINGLQDALDSKQSTLMANIDYITPTTASNAYVAKTSEEGIQFTTTEKTKLNSLSNYALPTASDTTLGGVKIGTGLAINNGVLSTIDGDISESIDWDNITNKPNFAPSNAEVNVQADWDQTDMNADDYIKNKPTQYALPMATPETLGGIKVGAGLNVNNGVLSAAVGGTADSVDWSNVQNKPIIPEIPTNISVFTNDAGYLTSHQDISGKVNAVDLAPVATSGSYNDLTDKPTIANEYVLPTASSDTLGGVKIGAGLVVNAGVLSTTGGGVADSVDWDNIQNKPSFAPANAEENVKSDWNATSGDAQILNKPTIPVVPVNISAFNNDVGYLTAHQDISGKANVSELSSVATSGNYNDLINKPEIVTYVLPVAGSSIGGIKSGTDILVDANGNVSINDDSHNHIISNIDGLQTELNSREMLSNKTTSISSSSSDAQYPSAKAVYDYIETEILGGAW